MSINYPQSLLYAERGGFEPPKRFRRLHAFQACLFNHSSIFPFGVHRAIVISLISDCKIIELISQKWIFRIILKFFSIKPLLRTVFSILISRSVKNSYAKDAFYVEVSLMCNIIHPHSITLCKLL